MSLEFHLKSPPVAKQPTRPVFPDVPAAPATVPAEHTPEHIKLVDEAFAKYRPEKAPVLDAMWVYSAGLLLKDLAEDFFQKPDKEPEAEKKPVEPAEQP